jgi:glycosyltransferase involved in cell wall biosynthesis
MKILYSCLSQSWGGLEMRTIQGAEQLQNKNLYVDILCYPGSKINQEAQKKKIKCLTIKASGYFHPLQIVNLAGLLKKNSYSLIHTQFSKDLWVLVPALKYINSDIPLILTKRMESSVVKKDVLHKLLYKRVNLILAISNVIKQNVIQTCPVPEDKVIIHYNGVDLKKYNPEKAERNRIRNEFDIKDDEIVIGMLSRITYGKGYEEFLKAAGILNKEFSNLKFLLAGDSSSDEKNYEQKIKNFAEELSLSEKVVFTGFRDDTPDLLSAMDIFAFPSHAESFGNALIEAMAMEKPSVATNSHGVLDIINDGITGFLFNKKDEKDFAGKLRLLINSAGKRIVIGTAARNHVLKNFDIEKQTEKLIDLYRKLI